MEHKQLTWPQRGALWLRLGIRLGLTALAVWLAARFGRPLLSLFAPFLLALIAAAALNPLVKKLQRLLGWNRQVLTLLLLFLIFGLLGGGLALLVYAAAGQLVSLVQNWGGLLDSLQTVMDQLEALFARLLTLVPPQVNEIVENAKDSLFLWLSEAAPAALGNLGLEAGERAMGLPDGWTEFGAAGERISPAQRYMALGNSIALPCAFYIMEGIKNSVN